MKYMTFLMLSVLKLYASHVVIIGAGPSGLGAAIEAKECGHNVTIVEKRGEYSRLQSLFMNDNSVKLLRKWGVDLPQMHLVNLGEEGEFGIVAIKHLQEQLEKRATQLGAVKIIGELEAISDREIIVNSAPIRYDLLVGADGSHSRVRDLLEIEVDHKGKAVGISAFVPREQKGEMEISEPIRVNGLFLRRLKSSFGSLIFAQGPQTIPHEQFVRAVSDSGWQEDADFIANNKAWVLSDINIELFQCKTFSKDRAILIGDAAASASFFEGMGANTGFKSAEIAGRFFANADREAFQNEMEKAATFMVQDSLYLFYTEGH